MKLKQIIDTTHWLSIQSILLSQYPEVKKTIHAHRNVYEKLKQLEPVNCHIEIVISEYKDNFNKETVIGYDIYGRNTNEDKPERYALEFKEWKIWLGMEIANETIVKFSELEIAAHCLYEMTFLGFEESKIQEQFNKITEQYESLIKRRHRR